MAMGKTAIVYHWKSQVQDRVVWNESGKAGKNQPLLAYRLSPISMVKPKGFKQENDMILYQIIIQIIFSEFQIRSTKFMLTLFKILSKCQKIVPQ